MNGKPLKISVVEAHISRARKGFYLQVINYGAVFTTIYPVKKPKF